MGLLVEIQKDLGPFRLDVGFSAQGGVTGLLGASGCGKSLTLKCIAGVETPDRGHIELDGRVLFDHKKRINLPPQKRQVGYLFQNYALFPNMTVEQNIACGVRDRARRKEEAARLMESFRLADCRGKYPRQLSGGQQQRTALARILASRPQALLLDEPFSALDSYLKWQVELELTQRLEQFDGPVLFVTHDREEIYRQCRQVCVLSHGRSQPVQTVQALFDAPATRSAARLSGCQNLSPAQPLEDGSIRAQDWGAVLHTAAPLPAGFSHIGIRACHIRPAAGPGPNCLSCQVLHITPGRPADTLLLAAPAGDGDRALLRMEWDPQAGLPPHPQEQLWVELPPEKLLLLSGE